MCAPTSIPVTSVCCISKNNNGTIEATTLHEVTPDTEEKIPGDPEARRKLIFWVLALVGLYFLWEPLLEYLTPFEDEPTPIEDRVESIRARLVAATVFSVVLSLWLARGAFRLARRTQQSGRYPPPGMSVLFPTVIKRGKEAQRMAGVLMLSVGMCVVSAGFSLWYLFRFLEVLSPILE